MLTQSESTLAVSGNSSKTLQLLRKRLRQLLRVLLVSTICLSVAAMALAIWWFNSLNGLPDIGDPFDVAAFRAFRIPDDQNAFTFVLRANEKLTPIRDSDGKGPYPDEPKFSWSIANPKMREWAGENREALELFMRGAEQDDASLPTGVPTTDVIPGNVIKVVFLEASRRQESGDTAGAWNCHRAVLRMITHMRRRGGPRQRYWAKRVNRTLQRRLTDWVTDPRTTTPQLHTALDEVLKNEPNSDWDISTIKYGYIDIMRGLERPMPLSFQHEIEGEWTLGLGDMALSPTIIDHLEAARRFLMREPERSRRVMRLLCAQYLAHEEAHEMPPRKPAVWARFFYLTSTNPMTKGRISVPLYPVSPDAPAAARALSPQELASWLVATLDARLRLVQGHSHYWPWPPDRLSDSRGVRDRKAHRELVIMLATELYHRERGSSPTSDQALVVTYLKSLPDDRSPDVYDGTAPIVE